MLELFVKYMTRPVLGALAVAFAGFIGFGAYQYNLLQDRELALRTQIVELEAELGTTETTLTFAEHENRGLTGALSSANETIGELGDEVTEVTQRADTLQKIVETDEQLLQKYSKIYFLNEHYEPEALEEFTLRHTFDVNRPQLVHAKVVPYLLAMLNDAEEQGVSDIYVLSAYRSFGEQSSLKSSYKVIYGAGTANQFSADQGYSEHQLGTAVDFTTLAIGRSFDPFENTPAYRWLQRNAHKYGFVLSYPEGNAYYVFEPWHWRFVGVKLATDLHNEGKFFYDISQREIDEYIVNLFD